MKRLNVWAMAGIATIALLTEPATAKADAWSNACHAYAANNEMMQRAPAQNRAKWCDCIGDEFDPADDDLLIEVLQAQQAEEARGHAMIPSMLPPPLDAVGARYTDALGKCLPALLGQ